MKHAIHLLAGVLSFGLLTTMPAVAAQQSSLDQCIQRLVTEGGKRLEHVKIKGHHFHCYPAVVSQSKGVKRLTGRLHHDIRNLPGGLRPDDTVEFRFSLKDDELMMEQPRITRGGIIGVVGKYAAASIGKWLPRKQGEHILRGYAETVTGKGWDDVASYIIANAGLKFAKLK